MKHRLLLLVLLSLAIHAPAAATPSSSAQDSLRLYGTWRWSLSWGGLGGTHQTPESSGFGRRLYFNQDGTYSFIEQDTVSQYLICRGTFRVHRANWHQIERVGTASIWLELEGWQDAGLDRLLVVLRGEDTLFTYPGGGDIVVADALRHRFVRESPPIPLVPAEVQPWTTRPPRLVSYGNVYVVELQDSLFHSLIRLQPFHKALDFQYPEELRHSYRHTHYQTPAALIGDFDADSSLDVVLYGHVDSLSTAICLFAGKGPRRTAVVFSEPTLLGPLTADPSISSYREEKPSVYLELVTVGTLYEAADGRQRRLSRDAIRAVRLGGNPTAYTWDEGEFREVQLANSLAPAPQPSIRVLLDDGQEVLTQRIRVQTLGGITLTGADGREQLIAAKRIRKVTDEHGDDRTKEVLEKGHGIRVGEPRPQKEPKLTAMQRGPFWGARAGIASAVGSFHDMTETGVALDLLIEWRPRRHETYGVKLDFAQFGGKQEIEDIMSTATGGAVSQFQYRLWGASGSSRLLIHPDHRVVPFLLTSLGVMGVTTSLSGSGAGASKTVFGLAQDLGLGFEVRIGRTTTAEVLAAYSFIVTKRSTVEADGVYISSNGFKYVPFKAGLIHRF